MRISVLTTIRHLPWGAPGQCVATLVDEMLRSGHAVQWLVVGADLDHPEVIRLQKLGAQVKKLPDPPPRYVKWKWLRRKLFSLTSGTELLDDIISKFEPDHIFVNQGGTWCALEPEIWHTLHTKKKRYSLICHLGSPGEMPAGVQMEKAKQLALGAKKIYFNSHWTQQCAEKQIGQDLNDAVKFQLPVRFSFAEPLAWPEVVIPKIGMVNRIDIQHKGLDLAVEAAAILKKKGLSFTITIAGRGENEKELLDLIRRHGVESEVKMVPYTEDLQKFWSEHELLLLPSRYEGLAVSMLEAMGFGRPVIRTPFGGCEEWMEEGVNGWICPEAGVAALADTLRKAIRLRPRWREMGVAAHQKVKKDLDPRPGRVFLESLV